MSSFRPLVPPVKAPDPTRHVNYTLGMILGVDDFTQEFAYLAGRDQWLARNLLGYGTVCGLRVSRENDAEKGPGVAVSEGVALSPKGELIRVPAAQCAYLNAWLLTNKPAVLDRLGPALTGSVVLYVALCYRDCPTDSVPIPGEPCRTEEESMAPSRRADDFRLELRWDAPDQREEDALRDFVAWLRQIEIGDGPGPFATLEEFEAAVRGAAYVLTSPPLSPPDFMIGSPTFGSPPAALRIHSADACEYLRAAFRIWATELRPAWLGKGQRCGTPPDEGCLLLAELTVPLVRELNGDWRVDSSLTIGVNEARRPYLIHLRLLQEWLLCGQAVGALTSPPAAPMTGDLTRIVALSWEHGENSLLDVELDGAPRKALVVGFGKQGLGDAGRVLVRPGSLDDNSFQVFLEQPETQGGVDLWSYRGVGPERILPVQPEVDASGRITRVVSVPGPDAMGAAFLFSPTTFDFLRWQKIVVVIKGDFILDETGGRAIAAAHRRAQLPTGEVEAQGGQFESWLRIGMLINVNTAAEAELQSLPGIGPALAARIVQARTTVGQFTSVDDLITVPGIGPQLLNQIRPFITVG